MNPTLLSRIAKLKELFKEQPTTGGFRDTTTPTHVALTAADELEVPDALNATPQDKAIIHDVGIRRWINSKGLKLAGLYIMFDSPKLRIGHRRRFIDEVAA